MRRLGREGAARVRGQPARLGARLARDDVRLGASARPARAVGAAHGARPRRGGVRLHGAGDRRRGAGGRHADPARRRREARRRARLAASARTAARARPACTSSACSRAACTRRRATRSTAARAVICNVTPTQLYGDLLDGYGAKAERFRYGRSEMQIHFALSEPPQWDGDERLGGTAIVHLTPGLDGVSRAVNEAERGLAAGRGDGRRRAAADDGSLARAGRQGPPLDPAAGAAVAGQGRRRGRARRRRRHLDARACASATPTASRRGSRGTSRTSSRRSSSASRSRRPICRRRTSTSSTATRTAARSRSTRTSSGAARVAPGHRTPVEGVWHIGASTHPGPGLGGGSGALVAQQLLEPPFTKRMVSRLRGSG